MAQDRVESVERAFSILEAFAADRTGLTLAQLAEETGLNKSTILRLSGSLLRYGYLRRDRDGRFRLGPALWRLGSLYRRSYIPHDAIRPALQALVRATGETASFYVIDADERLCIFRENSPNVLRHHLEEGARLSLRHGAGGHVLSAYGLKDPAAIARLDPDGGCLSIGERNPSVVALAVPVFDAEGAFQGALSVSGPRDRMDLGGTQNLVRTSLWTQARALAAAPG